METSNTVEPNLTTPPTSSSSSAIQPTPATFSLPSPSMRKSSASKLDYLYEINYVPDEQKIISEDLPIINPYHAFDPTKLIFFLSAQMTAHNSHSNPKQDTVTGMSVYAQPASTITAMTIILIVQKDKLGKKAQKYLQQTGQQPIVPMQITPPMALPQICMVSPANYEKDFPPLQPATTNDGIETRQPKVFNSRTVEPDETFKRVAPAEVVLNWQSENLIAQNKTILERLESQIQKLHQELRSLAMTSSSRLFAEKEAEMKSLQTQLTALQKQAHRGFTEPSEVPWRFTTIPKQEQPLPVVPQKEDHIKRLMRLLDEDDALRKLKGKQKELPSSSQMIVQPQSQGTSLY
ncbi:hypothetical protein TIFTF001_029130 [Ficus carica]|uniref:Uncharacterized protein n=1 Tax=Ficus carica TaxID=3494 RepID=A0AA88DR92_FICCA|nr:hypothetical protein TIFTF001_029130 [Ficus carica]